MEQLDSPRELNFSSLVATHLLRCVDADALRRATAHATIGTDLSSVRLMTRTPFMSALASDDVSFFIGNPQPREDVDINGRTLLHQAVAANATDVALWMLDNDKPDVNRQDNQGEAPLMRAAWLGNTAVVRELLAAGADPRQTARTGGTALHHVHAGGKNVEPIREALLAAGADPKALDKSGQLPESWASQAEALAQGQAMLNRMAGDRRKLSLRR